MTVAERAAVFIEGAVRAVSSPVISGLASFNRWRLPPRDAPHPLLTGIHQPMIEELTLTDLVVEGTIPAELDGRYVRIGPNPVDPDPRSYHFFTGDGMLHGIRIADGRAHWYRNRWVRSNAVAKARGVAPAPGPRHIFDTVNTSIIGHSDGAYALVEAGSTPLRFGQELGEQRFDDFGGTLPGSFTAHPRRDPATGELHAICYEATDPNRVRYNVVDLAGRVRRSVVIPVSHGPLIHDCAITDRFVIILDLPLTLSLRTVVSGHGFPYRWNEGHPARLGLLPREGDASEIRWISLDPCFVFHTANAYDLSDGRVILDVIAYDRMFSDENDGPDAKPRGFERWTIDPVAGTVDQHLIDETPQELPRIDERRTGCPYRYAYAMGLPDDISETLVGEAPLFKHDHETDTRRSHDFGQGRIAGEFMFVPRGPGAAEDDGWLMGFVIDADRTSTALEIIDAREIEQPPVATIRLPHRVPPGIHGTWLPVRPAGKQARRHLEPRRGEP
jgi:8'-apo-carotenoid 13,14-cleaving dioxygenase